MVSDQEQVLNTAYSGIGKRQRLVIRDEQAWAAFWTEAHGNMMPKPERPAVDFSASVVIAAAMGSRSTGGYSVDLQVAETDDGLRVYVTETSPGPSCITTQAFTAPLAAVRVPRTAASVSFVEQARVSDCEP